MRPTIAVPLVLLALLACDDGGPPDRGGPDPLVVATIQPLASIVEAVVGGAAGVRTLLPPGAHPDSYQATPRDAEALNGADLLVRVGGAADDWVGMPPDINTLVFTEGMELVGAAGHGTGNPHVWLDPILVRDAFLPRLTDALAGLVPDSAAAIRERATAYADSLTALDAWIRETLRDAPERRFVAAHPAWPYFAARYGLEQAGVLHESPGHELGSRALGHLIDEAHRAGVRAVIAEPQLGTAGVRTLARELGARIEVADAVGGSALEGRGDYLSLMRYNALAFARALGGGAPAGQRTVPGQAVDP